MKNSVSTIILLIFLFVSLSEAQSGDKLSGVNDLKNKKLGVLLGSTHDTYALEHLPDSKILQYKTPSEIVLAVRSGKVDAAIYTTETLREILRIYDDLTLLGDTLFAVPVAMGFNKENDTLREKFNAFFKEIRNNGVFNDMKQRWLIDGSTDTPVIKNKKNNGVLTVGVVSDKGLPFAIVKNNRIVGFDIEFVERFAAYLGKELKLADMDFGSLIISAATKKIDMISSTLMITEERAKQIDYSDPYLRLGASLFTLKQNVQTDSDKKMKVLDDIANKRAGVYAGTIHDKFVEDHYPNAEIKRFNTPSDILLSLKMNKVDVAFLDLAAAKVMMKNNSEIGILTEDALTLPIAVGFNKNNTALREEFNSYLKEIKENGTYDKIFTRWFVNDPDDAEMPKFNFSQDAPVLKLAVAVGDFPNSAIKNGEHVGFDIEMINAFAKESGYNLKIQTMEFGALIAALSSGKVDMIADGIAITEERAKQIAFSDNYNYFKTAVLALKNNLADADINTALLEEDIEEEPSAIGLFFQGIGESFENNIVKENRYLLILDGLKTTAIISVFAALFGTLLGGLICFMRMSKKQWLLLPSKLYISILRGTPVLVVLMIIFYVVFASVDIDPVFVAVIAFGLNFAAYVSEMFRTGIEGVDKGQTEAGIAMGFTKVKTFIYIVLPQAVRRILPVYKGEMISLVKMTSIVGYIAVQDLTKASDIIRSRTFDAFFPLIMVAVLYFLISWLLMLLLGYVERITNPKLKTRRG